MVDDNINKIERLKLHIKKRNKILSELQYAYVKYSYHHSSELGISTFINNLSNEKLYSPYIIEDMLIEMKELKKFNNKNKYCYRCEHFLNVPQNLIQNLYEKISNYTEEYLTELNFIQSIVWLKSAIMFMKTISIEQFHLVFHKQWKNIGKNSDLYNQDSISHIQDNDHNNLINLLNNDQENYINFNDNLKYTSSIDLSCNVQCDKKNGISQSCYQEMNQEIEIFTQKKINPCVFASYQSLDRYFNIQSCTQQNVTLNNCIIQDSDQDYSSSSDMFRDSLKSQDKIVDRESYKVEENNLINDKSVEKFSLLHSQNNGVLKTLMEMKDNLGVFPHDNNFSDILFNKEYSLCERNKLKKQLTSESNKSNKHIVVPQTSDLDFHHENLIISNQIDNACSPQKDSAYDTYQLSAECISISNYIDECEKSIFSSQKIDKITPRQKNGSEHDIEFLTTDITEKDWILNQDQQLCLSFSRQKSDISANNVKSYTQKRHSQKYSFEECEENRGKRKRLKSVHELTLSEVYKGKNKKISSEWLKFILDSLNVDDVVFESAKMILSVFQNERIGKLYMTKRCWKDTLEEQALNAILDFCDISEAKYKTNAYTQEIVQIVTNILDENIENIRLNKVTIQTYQITIILHLCTSMRICIEIINYLTTKLKIYENILISLKYRSVFKNEERDQSDEEIIPSVIDLWKKQLNFESTIMKDSKQTRERRWLMILDDFTVIATENFVQFAKKSRKLVNLLTI